MTTNRARPRSRFLTTGIVRVFAFVFLLLQLAVPLATVQTAVAASGDFSIDFVASAPYSYDHLTGGGAYDDRTVGTTSGDIVESLEGGDFACGDIVTYLAAVSVDNTAGANADEPQTIEMDFSFLMDTTGQSGVAIGDIVLVQVNDGSIQDLIAGEDTIDQGMIVDPTGTPSTATLKNEWMVGTMFQPGGVLWGTVELTGLDAGEQIIVRIDTKLFCQPGSDPTGNLQADLAAARLTKIKGGTLVTPPQAIPGGAQTIPFKQFGNIAMPAIDVQKTVTTADGTCPGVESLDVTSGDTVKYCYAVTDTGDAPLYNLALVDDNRTPADTSDDFAVTLTAGLTDVDGDGQMDDLAAGATASGTALVTITGAPGAYTNTVTATGYDAILYPTAYTDTDTASVVILFVPMPSIDVEKYVSVDGGASWEDADAAPGPNLPEGSDPQFKFVVTNTGNVELGSISLADSDFNSLLSGCTIPTTLAIGASFNCVITAPWAMGQHTDTATASGSYGGNAYNDTDDANYTGQDVAPTVDLTKTADPLTLPEPGGDFVFTLTIENTSAEDVTITALTDSNLDPLPAACTDLIGDVLTPGQIVSCSYTVSHTEVGSYPNTASVTVVDNEGTTASDSDDETVTVTDVATTITVDKTADPTSMPEPGGMVTFTVVVTNTSVEAVTLTSLADDIYGNLDGQGTCAIGGTIAAGASYFCSFEGAVTGEPGFYTDVVTAIATDNDGSTGTDFDDATVELTDVAPAVDLTKDVMPSSLPEPGGVFTFTLSIHNTSVEAVTITALTDTNALSAECLALVGTPIPAGDTVSCTYTVSHTDAGSYDNTASVTVADNEGNPASDSDTATVTVTNVMPDISITKTASPTSVPETGGDVTFAFVVTNDGFEDVTLTSLTDSVFGDLNGQGDCVTGGLILAGGSYSCSITKWLAGDDLVAHYNVTTAVGTDNEGTTDEATDDETVIFTDVAPQIQITKSASLSSVPETGGDVTFTFLVENIGQEDVTLTSLVDTIFGDLNGQGTCILPQTILVGDSYSCALTVFVSSDSLADHYNVVTATAVDDDGTPATDDDDETVTFTDVAPAIRITKSASPTIVPETGGNVVFTFLVENIGVEDVTLTSLTDTQFGDLTAVAGSTCVLPQAIAIGGSYSCQIMVWLAADDLAPHTNVATATAVDDDGTPATDDDDETVNFSDVAPAIRVTKTADPTHVPETGGDVTFTFLVENIGDEDVTLTSLTDTVFGDLNGQGDCALPQAILIGDSYSCSITVFLSSDSLTAHYNVTTATAVDDDNTSTTDDDDETVTFDDVAPDISITKTADPTSVPETGGDVTFTFVVTNDGFEDVTLTSLTDSVFGDLNGQGDCAIGGVIPVGGSYSCSITVWLEADDLTAHTNVVTAVGTDDDGTSDTATDHETVSFSDVLPDISVTKTADPILVPETGGWVTFTYVVTNNGLEDVTITSLSDSVYGPLAGDDDCQVGTVLPGSAESMLAMAIIPSGQCEFSITEWVEGDYSGPDHVNIFTAIAEDNDGNADDATDDATVDFENVMPTIMVEKTADPTAVPETGGTVTFTYVVTNTSSEEPVTITSLADDIYGALAGDDDCAVGTVLAAGASCDFAISQWVEGDFTGPDHVNVFTAHAVDNDGTDATDDDDATVDFTNVAPAIMVEKTADPISVPETGGDVTFTFRVTNISTEEPVTITSLSDSVYGLLAGNDDCKVGTVLAAGAWCEFTLTVWVEGDYSGPDHHNVFTAVAEDNDGTDATDDDDATVDFENVLPAIEVTKTANPTAVPETGGDVTFTFVVKNTSSEEPVTITSLADSVYGTLAGDADCAVNTALAAGASCEFAITRWVEGDFTGPDHVNVFTAKAIDNDNTEAMDDDDATVDFTDVPPTILVTKTVNPTAVPETGGDVTFTIEVKNTSSEEAVTLIGVVDTVFGPLDVSLFDKAFLLPGETATYSFTEWMAGEPGMPHENVVTVTAEDNDGTDATGSDDADVTYTDVLPDISIAKTANPTSVPETGGNVTFTFLVTNHNAEAVTLTSLSDDVFGDLNGQGTCAVPQPLAGNGGTYTCTITKWIAGDYESGVSHENTATAVASDNDGNSDTASDDATVAFTNVTASIDVEKYVSVNGGTTWVDADAAPGPTLLEGANPQFKFVVTNTGNVELGSVSLTDSDFALAGCTIPSTLAVGASFECVITAPWTLGQHTDTAEASGSFTDGAGNAETDTDTDDANYYGYEQTGALLPTQTTCEMYRDGMWPPMYDAFLYQVKGGKISAVAPGVIFYYNTITAPAASFTLTVGETNSLGWKPMLIQDLGQAVLFDASCNKAAGVTVTAGGTPYTVTFTVTGATEGATYYIGVKYSPQNVIGQPVSKVGGVYPTSIYTFGTSINGAAQLGSETSIPLSPKK